MYQGRVYSISGKDKRFPALSTVFPGEYKTIHPNCRHAMVGYMETFRSEEQLQKDIKNSNRPFEDDRTDEQKKAYKDAQLEKRHKRAELYQYERYKERLGKDAPKNIGVFRRVKHADGERWRMLRIDYHRRSDLKLHPEKALPNVNRATADDRKFTGYLFNRENPDGWAKGVAINSRLGYNASNFELIKGEILERSAINPSVFKRSDKFGDRYEQQMIIYGLKNKPTNVVVGWTVFDGKTWLSSAYIKEIKKK